MWGVARQHDGAVGPAPAHLGFDVVRKPPVSIRFLRHEAFERRHVLLDLSNRREAAVAEEAPHTRLQFVVTFYTLVAPSIEAFVVLVAEQQLARMVPLQPVGVEVRIHDLRYREVVAETEMQGSPAVGAQGKVRGVGRMTPSCQARCLGVWTLQFHETVCHHLRVRAMDHKDHVGLLGAPDVFPCFDGARTAIAQTLSGACPDTFKEGRRHAPELAHVLVLQIERLQAAISEADAEFGGGRRRGNRLRIAQTKRHVRNSASQPAPRRVVILDFQDRERRRALTVTRDDEPLRLLCVGRAPAARHDLTAFSMSATVSPG